MADPFGISGPVKALVPPEAFEDVHADGMSWARRGANWQSTTRIGADDWNAVIANLRGLLTISGVDLSDLADDSPLFLREALTRAIAASYVFTPQGGWTTATAYAFRDAVTSGGASYWCIAAHTSGASTEPGVGVDWESKWALIAAKGATGATAGVLLAYSTTTADADPGAGVFRLNHATIASVTGAYVDNVDQDGASIAGYLDTFDDSTNTVRGHLVLRGVTSPSAWAIFSVTGSVVNGTGYRKLTLAYVGSGGTFTNNDVFALSFSRAGDAGAGAVSSVNGATGTVVLYSKDVTPGAWQDVASASTVNLSASAAFRYRITGTTTITALTLGNDKMAVLRFAGALTLTHNATSLILPTGANITTAADDTAWITSDASGNISVISYHRATGLPLGLDAATTAARGGVTLGSEVREKLAANRNYYVRTDGSDSNTGLANTSGGAFLTIQKAIDVILGSLDLNIYDVSVNIASGTYSGAISVAAPVVGSGRIILNGDTTTPSNIDLTGGISVEGGGRLFIQGVKVSSTGKYASVHVKSGGYLKTTGKNEFGGSSAGHRIAAIGGGVCEAAAAEVVSGTAAGGHYYALLNGYINCEGATWTASGTAAQGVFAHSLDGAISAYSNTSSGTFTGQRYLATYNAVIRTYGGGASYFPGNSAGGTSTGGLYD